NGYQEFVEETEPIQSEPKTASMDGLKSWFTDWNERRKERSYKPQNDNRKQEKIYDEDKRSALDKMRDKVAEFDEDYKGMGERFLGFFMQVVGYLGPFALVLWIGSDLGKYYAPVMDTIPAYGLAYTMECIIAACTIALG